MFYKWHLCNWFAFLLLFYFFLAICKVSLLLHFANCTHMWTFNIVSLSPEFPVNWRFNQIGSIYFKLISLSKVFCRWHSYSFSFLCCLQLFFFFLYSFLSIVVEKGSPRARVWILVLPFTLRAILGKLSKLAVAHFPHSSNIIDV